jgi:hypothetical protein
MLLKTIFHLVISKETKKYFAVSKIWQHFYKELIEVSDRNQNGFGVEAKLWNGVLFLRII